MSDDQDETSDELGKTSEKVGGIADRFGETTDMRDATETDEPPETSDTTDDDAPAPGTTETTNTTSTTETSETGETIETTTTTETADTVGPDDEGFVLREDWNGRTIYLSDDVVNELDMRYSEVNVAWQREHGEQLPKNERFYPALVQAALNRTTIEEELGLGD